MHLGDARAKKGVSQLPSDQVSCLKDGGGDGVVVEMRAGGDAERAAERSASLAKVIAKERALTARSAHPAGLLMLGS
jgi:hypothetical protein